MNNLESPLNEMYQTAYSFNMAYSIIKGFFDSRFEKCDESCMLLLPPMIVLCSFTCEMYLKAILGDIKLKSFKKKTHSLKTLLNALEEDTIKVIRDGVIDKMGDKFGEAQFNAYLESQANVFEEWRYVHEFKDSIGRIDFIDRLLQTLRQFADRNGIMLEQNPGL